VASILNACAGIYSGRQRRKPREETTWFGRQTVKFGGGSGVFRTLIVKKTMGGPLRPEGSAIEREAKREKGRLSQEEGDAVRAAHPRQGSVRDLRGVGEISDTYRGWIKGQ